MFTCKECKGECCKRLPGQCAPYDFINKDDMVSALESGKYTIDCWEAVEDIYYIRPATKGNEGEKSDYSWGGECTFLTNTGCSIKDKWNRPTQCLMLRPKIKVGERCLTPDKYGKYEMAFAWIHYQNFLKSYIDD